MGGPTGLMSAGQLLGLAHGPQEVITASRSLTFTVLSPVMSATQGSVHRTSWTMKLSMPASAIEPTTAPLAAKRTRTCDVGGTYCPTMNDAVCQTVVVPSAIVVVTLSTSTQLAPLLFDTCVVSEFPGKLE